MNNAKYYKVCVDGKRVMSTGSSQDYNECVLREKAAMLSRTAGNVDIFISTKPVTGGVEETTNICSPGDF